MHGRNTLHCITLHYKRKCSCDPLCRPVPNTYTMGIKYRSEVREANIARHRTRRSVLSNLNGSSIKLPNAAFSRACNAM